MDALLKQVLDANGGLDHLRSLSTLRATITYGGPFWAAKGHPDLVGADDTEADLRRPRLTRRQRSTGRSTTWDGSLAAFEGLEHPRASFAGFGVETPWNLAQILYFRSYATWHYLVEPELFSWPGVEAREAEPWTEGGETWRVLAVTYPESIAVHSRTQRYYYDDKSHLRRLDYAPEVNGDVPVAHYIRADERINGVLVPTSRHIHLRNPDGSADLSWTPITVDLHDIVIA
ncbi:hypothetical protein [Paractinoplanes toevensis]|uniref:Uncharacterized protein n=1 Tax=Paractinoplanes toevensis TaxID=571911 RepID=A0A919TJ35_9ACTN|nr:hypothetical protein [Actinoplanes toevensis]GIM95380.1 hypothetical protein Ato02nite_071730 [Actinoplanes toevensis]